MEMRKTIKLLVAMVLVSSVMSGCIIDPWWGGHGGRGGGHYERR
jgi:hypothetical protein